MGVTSNFRCQQSVKQGCPFSTLLFGLYLDALEGRLDGRECNAPALTDLHVWLLFFANDLYRTPNSLKDSNVSPSERQRKREELGHAP
jgi:hypothetical protein